MNGWSATLAHYAERVDALSLRERVTLFAGAVAVLAFVTVQWGLGPLNERERQLKGQVERRLSETLALQTQFEILGRQYAEDPNAGHRARLDALRADLGGLRDSLGELTTGLVSPAEMARVVEQALNRNRRLKVEEVASLVDVPLLSATRDAAKPTATEAAPLHKHGLRLKLRGSYRDIVAYLRELEALPWKVFWGRAALTTTAWPESEIEIVIYTLSRDADWIGTG